MTGPETEPQFTVPDISALNELLDGEPKLPEALLQDAYNASLPRAVALCTTPSAYETFGPNVVSYSDAISYQSAEGNQCEFRIGLLSIPGTPYRGNPEMVMGVGLLVELDGLPYPPIIELYAHGLSSLIIGSHHRTNAPQDLQSLYDALEAFDGQAFRVE